MGQTTTLADLAFWSAVVLSNLALAGWLAWTPLSPRRRARPPDDGAKTLVLLRHANDVLGIAVMAERNVVTALAALPTDVPPMEAEATLRRLMPDADVYDRHALAMHAWRDQRRPQALAALAGMALRDVGGNRAVPDVSIGMVVDAAGPDLLDHLAGEMESRMPELDRWLQTGGMVVRIERAADRVAQSAPNTASRLRRLAAAMEPRTRQLLRDALRFHIERFEEASPSEFEVPPDPVAVARALASMCLPRYPELMEEALGALRRKDGRAWEIAECEFIGCVIREFGERRLLRGLDVNSAVDRLCAGMASPSPGVSAAAAAVASSLLAEDWFENGPYHRRLHAARDRATERLDGGGRSVESSPP